MGKNFGPNGVQFRVVLCIYYLVFFMIEREFLMNVLEMFKFTAPDTKFMPFLLNTEVIV